MKNDTVHNTINSVRSECYNSRICKRWCMSGGPYELSVASRDRLTQHVGATRKSARRGTRLLILKANISSNTGFTDGRCYKMHEYLFRTVKPAERASWISRGPPAGVRKSTARDGSNSEWHGARFFKWSRALSSHHIGVSLVPRYQQQYNISRP